MTAIYVKEQGARVSRRGDRLVVSKQGQILDEVPLTYVDKLVLMGNIQVTTQATAALLSRQIDVIYLSSTGTYRGHLQSNGSKNVRLRHQQMRRFDDPTFCLHIAQPLVIAKINNQRTILQRQVGRVNRLTNTNQPYPADRKLFNKGLKGMKRMQSAAVNAKNVDVLRGYEGKASAYYFQAVRSLLSPAWGFKQRDYYPPPDPFNALLSFAYTMVFKEIFMIVQTASLDPYLGFFHEIKTGRPALPLDLMEEWRPVVADALALELVNRGTLKPESFRRTRNPRRPVELGPEGITQVVNAYESRLETLHYHPMAGPGGQTSVREIMRLQVRQIVQIIQNKREKFEPYLIR